MTTHDQRLTWWTGWQKGHRSLDEIVACDDLIGLYFLDYHRNAHDEDIAEVANDALRNALTDRWDGPLKTQDDVEFALDTELGSLLELGTPWFDDIQHGFLIRRERDMIDQRRVTPEQFRAGYLNVVHERVLWGRYRVNHLVTPFRLDAEHAMLDHEERSVCVDAKEKIGVVHALEMNEHDRSVWDLIFADYDLHGFDQLQRPIQHQYGPQVHDFEIRLTGQPSMIRLGELGWRGQKIDTGEVPILKRRFAWSGHLEFAEIIVHHDELGLVFRDLEEGGRKAMQRVNPIALFETIRSAQQAIAFRDSMAVE